MQAPNYSRDTSFAADEAANIGGRSTVRTDRVDAEFDDIGAAYNALNANVQLNQRDDGEIRDQRVKLHTLAPDVLKLVTAAGGVLRGAWLTATAYALKDVVTQSGNTYIAALAHTSGTFATDLAAGRWILIQLGSATAASGVPFTPTGTIASTNVQDAINEADTEGRALTAAEAVARAAADTLIRTDLANTASASLGANLVGFNYSLSYGVGTIGAWLRDLALAAGSTLIGWLQSGTGATTRTVSAKLRETVSVKDFGAVGDGVTNDHAAFAAAWAAIKSTGGTILIPPGTYLLNTQWNCDVDSSLPFNYSIIGYGAQLLAGAAVTGHAMRVYGGYNNFGVKIEGLHFNHRNNTTVGGCIQGLGAANLRIIKCSMEAHNTTALYSAIDLGPITVGVGDTNCFWTLIDGFTTRQRSGGDGTLANIGVQLRGTANATKIINCSFGGVISAIRFNTDGTAAGLANGVVIDRNDFEGVTAAITINTASPATAMPTGLRITNNRVEVATAFINISGALVTDPSNPLIAAYNYLVPGSVTNYLINPNSQLVFLDEPALSGTGTLPNIYGGNRSTRIQCEGAGYNLEVTRIGGGAGTWQQAHILMCGHHLWVDSSSRLRIKNSTPASDTDGTVVGTQT